MAVRPCATVVTAPAVPRALTGMRSSVPWLLLLTQTAPLWTLMPLAPKPAPFVGSSTAPSAQMDAVRLHRDTFQTLPVVESVAYKAFPDRSIARPLRAFTSGRA